MRNVLATLCQLLALIGLSVAAWLVNPVFGLAVTALAVGVVGVALAPEWHL